MSRFGDGFLGGIFVGDVVFNQDPQKWGRVQVRVEEVYGDKDETPDEFLPFGYVMSLGGGFHDGGSHLIPPIGTTVYVMFEHGSKQRPVVMGGAIKEPEANSYGEDGVSMGKWESKGTLSDIPKEGQKPTVTVNGKEKSAGPSEPTLMVLYKTPKGATVYMEEKDEGEFLRIVDRSGQGIEFSSPVTTSANAGNEERREKRNKFDSDGTAYADLVNSKATVKLIDIAGQNIHFIGEDGKERVLITNRDRAGTSRGASTGPGGTPANTTGIGQELIMDMTAGAEHITLIDKDGQQLRFDAANKDIYLEGHRDWLIDITRDVIENIGRDETVIIGRDKKLTVGNNDDETILNNKTKSVSGNEADSIFGNLTHSVFGNETETVLLNKTKSITGNETDLVMGNQTESFLQNLTKTVILSDTETIMLSKLKTVFGTETQTILVNLLKTVTGLETEFTGLGRTMTVTTLLSVIAGSFSLLITGAGAATATGASVDMSTTFKTLTLITTDPVASLKLGSAGAAQSLVLGDIFLALFNIHTHDYLDVFVGSPPAGAIKTTTIPNQLMVPATHLSTIVKTA